MTALLEMVLPAAGVSLLALACLALLPRAPSELRFSIAAAGLAAWAIPWPALKWTLPLAAGTTPWALPLISRVDAAVDGLAAVQEVGGGAAAPFVPWLVGAAFAIGAAWFVADCARMRAAVRSWRARSAHTDALRELLPEHLRGTDVEIRTVRDSPHAAASGYLRPTIWIGDELRDRETVRAALLHECWHVRRRDPLKILLLAALRRAYWWNPLVLALAKQAALMLEATCDRRCARELGKELYVAELARTMLAASGPPLLTMAAAAGGRGSNLLRLELLNRETVMQARDHVVVWVFAASVVALGACRTIEPQAPSSSAAATPTELRDAVVQSGTFTLTASRFVTTPDGSAWDANDVRVVTTAFKTVVIRSRLFSMAMDKLTLSGDVQIAVGGIDLEADEATIRALDGGPIDLNPARGTELAQRGFMIEAERARLISAYR